jgi:L-alanine-DL-glutamate epimerase-like enolase superfamily enzyme
MPARASQRTLEVRLETFAYKAPFRISGYTFDEASVILAIIGQDGIEGRGESSGIYFIGETAQSMAADIEAYRAEITSGLSRSELQSVMPANGARNALDCALWELEARLAGKPAWSMAGIGRPQPLLTTQTLGADDPAAMAQNAVGHADARALKLKLTGESEIDGERVRAVRKARPDVWIGVDGNQGFTPDTLAQLLPTLVEAEVRLVEQPFARGREVDLDGFERPIPFAADESALNLGDVAGLVGRFDVLNIKLDKCGGLTEGLAMATEARRLGLKVMVGNMGGTSLAMAPAFILGQSCDIVDLDGPLFLRSDRTPSVTYKNGLIECPDAIWGAPVGAREAAG